MEKYEARSFLNLITDDYVNREALTWVTHWGSKKEVKKESTHINSFQRVEKDFKKPVLLLYGVPGGGKTTLAKVIASHCKYVPWEMNCSLEGKDIIQKIRHALHIQNVKGLPVCIILDMIDCLDKDSITQLQKILNTGKRPVIAIANDFYAGVLKIIKPHCYHLNCRSIHPTRVYNRLREICESERVKIDMTHLSSLCTEYNHDIRACLNNLQSMSSIREGSFVYITRDMLPGFSHSSMHRNVYDLWRFIFSSKNYKEAKKAVRNFGEYELVNSGIYENYTSFSNNDYDLRRSADLLVKSM
jgi:DNA polymerase III delta prime subunit